MPNLTIDTNVFLHASDPRQQDKFLKAASFLEDFIRSDMELSVDETYNEDEAKNLSKIWSEYLEHVNPTDLGYQTLLRLVANDRIVNISTNIPQAVRKAINQSIPDSSDRVFAKVAFNSDSKKLISNDLKDFSEKCRRALKKKNICIIQAPEDVEFDT